VFAHVCAHTDTIYIIVPNIYIVHQACTATVNSSTLMTHKPLGSDQITKQ
jgi:hypothetical protein